MTRTQCDHSDSRVIDSRPYLKKDISWVNRMWALTGIIPRFRRRVCRRCFYEFLTMEVGITWLKLRK